MTLAERSGSRLEIGRIAIFTVHFVRHNLLSFCALSTMVAIPAGILRYQEGVFPDANLWDMPIAIPFAAYMIGSSLLTAIIARTLIPDGTGHHASLATSIAAVISDLLPLSVIGLIGALAVVIGVFALVLPGLLLAVILAVLMPVRIIEKTGFVGTFVRSVSLTKGHRWPIFGLVIASTVLEVAGDVAVNVMMGDEGFAGYTDVAQSNGAAAIISTAIIAAAVSLVTATGTVVLYCELRRIKDGPWPNELASEFD